MEWVKIEVNYPLPHDFSLYFMVEAKFIIPSDMVYNVHRGNT